MKSLTLIAIIILVLCLAAPAYADEHPPRPEGYADAASTKVASQHRPEPTHRPTVTPAPYPYPMPVEQDSVIYTLWYRIMDWVAE